MANTVVSLDRLLAKMAKYDASDLHLKAGSPPIFRISGRIRLFEAAPLDSDAIHKMFLGISSKKQQAALEEDHDVDFSYSMPGSGRFRVNAYFQRGSLSVAVRRVKLKIPTFEMLNLPKRVMTHIASFRQGLVVVVGVTGSGKSTTLAAMIGFINKTRRCHVLTLEDPIEYLHTDHKAFINQREVGIDVLDFHRGLRSALRQDPDVILIGEMRDENSLEIALSAAETGHLVFGTLHASSVPQSISRILDLFQESRHRQVQQSLAFNLKAIVAQKMLPAAKPGINLVVAQEILIMNPAVTKLIREGQIKKIATVLRSSKEEGMQDFNQSLHKLCRAGLISEKVALEASHNPDQLKMQLTGIVLSEDRKITE